MKSINSDFFSQRRAKLLEQIKDGIGVVFAAPVKLRNGDAHYAYRTDSDFYYLTGLQEAQAAAIFVPQSEKPFRLFVQPKDPKKEMWDGKLYGVDAAKETFGADLCFPISEFEQQLKEVLPKAKKVYYPMFRYEEWDSRMQKLLFEYKPFYRRGDQPISTMASISFLIAEQRARKDALEIELMRASARNSARAHTVLMESVKPGMMEYEAQAILEAEFRKGGAQDIAYTSIVASGANATTLHYIENNRQMNDGDLLLVDAGGEIDCYASDITRTYPVNGKFSKPQKQIYELVLKAQEAAIAMSKPGETIQSIHEATTKILVQGLLDLKILSGSLDKLLESKKEYAKFFPHGTGHLLGLDVHDVGALIDGDGKPTILEPGYCFTIEPGLYFREDYEGVPKEYLGIGIRIEDDILITKDGCEVLTADVPKSIAEIEAIVGRKV